MSGSLLDVHQSFESGWWAIRQQPTDMRDLEEVKKIVPRDLDKHIDSPSVTVEYRSFSKEISTMTTVRVFADLMDAQSRFWLP